MKFLAKKVKLRFALICWTGAVILGMILKHFFPLN